MMLGRHRLHWISIHEAGGLRADDYCTYGSGMSYVAVGRVDCSVRRD